MNATRITVCAGCQSKEQCRCSDTREVLYECSACLQTFDNNGQAENCCSKLSRYDYEKERPRLKPTLNWRTPSWESVYGRRR